MDYGKLSDYEVSKLVAMTIGGFLEEDFCDTHSVIFRRHGRHQYSFFEPCTNPSDAWPIIQENLLRVVPVSFLGKVNWVVSRDIHSNHDANPLRAAMITFLMMQDSANVPANSTGSDIR
ncbi:DUF2591 family protein [Citrobacter sp. Cpo090]|uniref:phage protein NinX family protein n=1 Tax=Citrobacter sp. Cpo090 TaxID=2985139 RepID=UPI002578E112|nr:phage protein NinX family protein [Citrobacter sp. Cpo090]MDM2843305.1 DUF2591 family protein [Citrobacter sp. Cpo090]